MPRPTAERVDELIGAYRGNGLGVAGLAKTRKAFELGQVDELLLPGNADQIGREAADELIARASQTSATVRIIEDASLLAPLGGVGAFLRFRTLGFLDARRADRRAVEILNHLEVFLEGRQRLAGPRLSLQGLCRSSIPCETPRHPSGGLSASPPRRRGRTPPRTTSRVDRSSTYASRQSRWAK
jgi:hypothetical protein